MAGRNIYYRISNTGFPSSDKKAQAGRYESDYNRIMRAISSATEGQARRLNYDVSTSGKGAGESSAIFSVPSQYQKVVDAVLTKTFQDITDSSSFSGQQNLLYSSRKTPFALELPFKKRALSAKAKAYYSASAKEHNAYDIVRKDDLIEGTIPVTKDTFDPSLVGEGGMYKGKKVTFTQFMKSRGMQKEYIKNMFASGDRFNAEVVESKKTKNKEKEAEKKEKEEQARKEKLAKTLLKTLSLIGAGIALLKKILTTLVNFASDRQRKSVEGIGLGYTASDLERFNRFERRVSAQEGSVFDTAQSIMQIAGNPIAFSENQDRFHKLIRAFAFMGGKDSPNSIKIADDLSKLASGSSEVTVDSILNDMFGMLATQWVANKKEGKDDLRQRISLLQDAGFNGLAELLGAFAVQYNEASPEGRTKLESVKNLNDFIDLRALKVSENANQWKANQDFMDLQEAISALKTALSLDAITLFSNAIKNFTAWIRKFLAQREAKIQVKEMISSGATGEAMAETLFASSDPALVEEIYYSEPFKKAYKSESKTRVKAYNYLQALQQYRDSNNIKDKYKGLKYYFDTYKPSDDFKSWLKDIGITPYDWEEVKKALQLSFLPLQDLSSTEQALDFSPLYEGESLAKAVESNHTLTIEMVDKNGKIKLDPIELQSRNDTIDKIIMNQTDFGYTLEQVGYV